MSDYKFEDEVEFLRWCESTINAIYYANIAMNNEAIKREVAEIANMLHVSEGQHFYNPERVHTDGLGSYRR